MSTKWRNHSVTVLAVVAAGAALLAPTAGGAPSGASAAVTKAQVDEWRGWHTFAGVTMMSSDSALTVGEIEVSGHCCNAMSQQWEGTKWTYESPRDGGYSRLTNIDSVSESDAWAVGFDFTSYSALTEHWDGHRWRVVESGDDYSVMLADVSMTASNDAWAVGDVLLGRGR